MNTQTYQKCVDVLNANWRGDHTVPSKDLYPHQWLWDSCFSAIGWSHLDVERAVNELRSLVKGQWDNGMIPNMIFAPDKLFRRDRRIWQSSRAVSAPKNIATSGITQPPLLAEAVWRVGQKLTKTKRALFFTEMYPKILKFHLWLYAERDPHQEGLVFLLHPYESGMDNSPVWTNIMHLHHKPKWITLIEKLQLDKLGPILRRDTKIVPAAQRMSNIDALLYWNVIRRMRRKNWDTKAILARSHFTVQDLGFNCMLVRANDVLMDIAKEIYKKVPQKLILSQTNAKYHIANKLHDKQAERYYSREFLTHDLIKIDTIAGLLPLYSGALSSAQAKKLAEQLSDPDLFESKFPVPSVPFRSHRYNEVGYWSGPTWLNINWLIVDGLNRYGLTAHAKKLTSSSIAMVEKSGAYEYFSALDGAGLGARDFSWTAALAIDLSAAR
jgi:hypothetical protein